MTSKFNSMSDHELKQHFLKHRDDESFHAYMDRRASRPKRVLLSAEETELPFNERVKLVEERLGLPKDGAQASQPGTTQNDQQPA